MRAYTIILSHIFCAFIWHASRGQDLTSASLWRDLGNLDTNRAASPTEKLRMLYEWKKQSEASRLPKDSVYARLLHKIGAYEWFAGRNYNLALAYTFDALRINSSGMPGAAPKAVVTGYFNVAYYFENLALLRKALIYFDSAILAAGRGPDPDNVVADSRLQKAYIFFSMGDYEKAETESNGARIRSLERNDSITYLKSLNQRAQALFNQGKITAAQKDVEAAILLAGSLHYAYELASAFKERGIIQSSLRNFGEAEVSYSKCIVARIQTGYFRQVASDYNDVGNFYSDSLKAYRKAEGSYQLAMQYARRQGDSDLMAAASVDLGRCYLYQHQFARAMTCYGQAAGFVKIQRSTDLRQNPTAADLAGIPNKALLQTLFNSKVATLLGIFRQTRDKESLTACLETAMLNDSLIRDIRHEQVGEQSKLYWRNRTRDFFADALEACYFAHKTDLAFHFMEESRSVLLQDKLNELGANAHLPSADAEKVESLQIHIVELQQRLNSMVDSSAKGRAVMKELLISKETLEKYIRSLEVSYPVYYQYKYADDNPSLSALQAFLAPTGQRFVEYFMQDSICYALCVEPGNTRLQRIARQGIGEELMRFVRFCSDENALSSKFPAFLTSGNGLYRLLLEPFGLRDGRVIVCQDNVLLPFEALSSDSARADFLVKRYAFSYVYSARYLMSRHEQVAGSGDFLGIAPVRFAAYRGLADLRLSEDALRDCATPYSRSKLLLNADASRENFIQQVCHYTTATILTHARPDSSDDEPVLFLNDSVIHLSELQMLRSPASRLVVLSACQTNVGKSRNGEGIFSLARGFSAAGIPAVAATQWMADEAAIYSISRKFNEYISGGMNKDEALQKAKLAYMFQEKRGGLLPCYWADMILIGNSEPVQFSGRGNSSRIITVVIAGMLIFAFLVIYRIRRREAD